jgi:hypothetical protein
LPSSLTARGAVLGIKEESSLAFQRPVVQDALRATVDAFARVSEQAAACPESQLSTRAQPGGAAP